ncbi:hypothetical protein [Gilvimarinus agarilyticus]|uniref:hypothetical protein n=1 Tax=Gilvimarinus agarilyticus TaxID=679259 RepID=UPI0005A08737|nr:hypothetical protein [Gilvimarinus agarilyticus]
MKSDKIKSEASPNRNNDDPETVASYESLSVLEKLPAEAEWLPADYDPYLLEHAKTLWQFGGWVELSEIDVQELQAHPERASIVLLIASALQQLDDYEGSSELVRLAEEWGASKKHIVRVLVAGVHNTLGKASAAAGDKERTLMHFEGAVSLAPKSSATSYVTRARAGAQLKSMSGLTQTLLAGVGVQAEVSRANEVKAEFGAVAEQQLNNARVHWCKGQWEILIKLDNAALPDTPNRGLLALLAACGYQQLADDAGESRCVDLAVKWGVAKGDVKNALQKGIVNRMARASALARNYSDSVEYFVQALDGSSFFNINGAEYLEARIKSQLSGFDAKEIAKIIEVSHQR